MSRRFADCWWLLCFQYQYFIIRIIFLIIGWYKFKRIRYKTSWHLLFILFSLHRGSIVLANIFHCSYLRLCQCFISLFIAKPRHLGNHDPAVMKADIQIHFSDLHRNVFVVELSEEWTAFLNRLKQPIIIIDCQLQLL